MLLALEESRCLSHSSQAAFSFWLLHAASLMWKCSAHMLILHICYAGQPYTGGNVGFLLEEYGIFFFFRTEIFILTD